MKLAIALSILSTLAMAEEVISQNDRFYDPSLRDYVRVCEKNGDKYTVKRSCSKFEEGHTRLRNEIFKEVESYKNLKKGDVVMINVYKGDGYKQVLAQISFLYENGDVSVMEYYNKRFGYNGGTINRTVKYDNLSLTSTKTEGSEVKEMCLATDYVLKYNHDNSREFDLKKGEAVKVVQTFSNGYSAITLKDHTWDDFQGYGLNNKLPIENSKLISCDNDKINDESRSNKSVEKDSDKALEEKSVAK